MSLYLLTGAVLLGSALTLPPDPSRLSLVELAGLIVAATLGQIFPVSNGPVGMWRTRETFVAPVLVVLALTSSPQAVVLAWFAGAIASGVVIRRGRFTPGRITIAELSRRLAAATSIDHVERLLVDFAMRALDTPSARLGPTAPGDDELGHPWGSGWLVAEDRRGPPTYNRPYRAEDAATLEAIVVAATAAVENLRLLARLDALSVQDELTGLPNRRGAERALEAAVATGRRHGEGIAVALFDLDHFKTINDTHGHPEGDRVLATVARRLQAASRAGETVARWGGEEFIAVLQCDPSDAGAAAERLRSAACGSIDGPGLPIRVTLSCGVACAPVAAETTGQDLVRRADVALYEAKRSGRDRSVAARVPERAAAGREITT